MKLTLDNNLTFQDLIFMVERENTCFDQRYWSSPEFGWEHYCHNKEVFICVRDLDTGEIVAHLSLLPILGDLSEQILDGKIIDSQITPDQILKYDDPCVLRLHLLAVAVAEEYRNSSALLLMYRALLRKVTELLERGFMLTGMTADCVTKEGELVCEKLLGMQCMAVSPYGSKIYWTDHVPALHNQRKKAVAK